MGIVDDEAIMEQFRIEEWERKMLSLDQFRAAVRSEAFQPITVKAGGVHFSIEGKPKRPSGFFPRSMEGKQMEADDRMTLCTSRAKSVRRFRNPSAALQVLREMGAVKVEVDMTAWYPKRVKDYGERKRPDMAERLTRAHRAAREEAIERWELEHADAGEGMGL